MSRTLWSVVFVLFCIHIPLCCASLKKQTNEWTEKYIYNEHDGLLIPHEDLQLIANLCYVSFQRSHFTLEAQACALKTLSSVWNGWQNIAQTRLTPAKQTPHTISEKEKNFLKTFWNLHGKQQKSAKAYAYAVDAIVDTEMLRTTIASTAVSVMRSQARSIVAQALVDVKKLLGDLFFTSQKKGILAEKALNLLDHLKTYIPQLAVYSFSEADTISTYASEDGWKALYTIQDVGVKTWEAIENARAEFYRSRYNSVVDIIKKNKLPKSCFEILFYEDGAIIYNKKPTYLPSCL